MKHLKRRKFLQTLSGFTVAAGIDATPAFAIRNKMPLAEENRFKLSLNAYSFNDPLINGTTNLESVMDFCAAESFDAIDLTGYYFPGYPAVPSDEYIFKLKRKAHQLGLEISGTGIRNDFGDPDKNKRAPEIALVKNWIEVAAKLGAPVIRIFTAKEITPGYSWKTIADWIVEDIKECVAYGRQLGIIVAVQNHNDFIRTAEQMTYIIQKVDSEWFGLVLDTGSYVTEEPYSEIAKTANYAVNWQIKEKLNYQGENRDMDLEKVFTILKASVYRGYLPIETLTPGDPFLIVPPFLKKVKTALKKIMGNNY